MVLHQLIQGIKLDHPQEVLPGSVSQHLEMLYPTTKSGGAKNVRGRNDGIQDSRFDSWPYMYMYSYR